MKLLTFTLLAILTSACGHKTEAEALAKILDSCDPGSTVSMEVTIGEFSNSMTTTCTWVKQADHPTTKKEPNK